MADWRVSRDLDTRRAFARPGAAAVATLRMPEHTRVKRGRRVPDEIDSIALAARRTARSAAGYPLRDMVGPGMNIIEFSRTYRGPARRIIAACSVVTAVAVLLALALDWKRWAGAILVICVAALVTMTVVIARAKPGRS